MNDVTIDCFRDLILQQTGLNIRAKDRDSLRQSIAARMRACQLDRPDAYYEVLCSSADASSPPRLTTVQRDREWHALVQLLTTGESYFFRDRQQLALLERKILPEIVRQKRREHDPQLPGKPSLKIWSAGCSSGEEAYSVAILVKQLLPDLNQWDVCILGTDLNLAYLDKARAGIYREWSFRQVHPDIKHQYFRQRGAEYEILPDIRKMVTFRPGNLVKDEFPNLTNHLFDMDIIICRNVFIYFDAPRIAAVLHKFHQTLNASGYLIAGHAELQGLDLSQFSVQSLPGSVVYQKKGGRQHLTGYRKQIRAAFQPFETVVQTPADRAPISSAPLNLVPETARSPLESLTIEVGKYGQQVDSTSASLAPEFADIPNAIAPITSPEIRLTSNSPDLDNEFQRARDLFERDDYPAATALAENLARSQPHRAEAHVLLARIHANCGSTSAAIHACEQALEIDPRSAAALHIWARVAEEQGNISEAKKCLKKIIYLHPESIAAYLDLATIYISQRDRGRGKKMYAAAIEILEKMPPTLEVKYREQTRAGKLLEQVKILESSQ